MGNKANRQLHTPGGLADMLPVSCQRKRAVEQAISTVFESYGYAFVSSPSLEYLEVFEGKGSISTAQIYKLVDKNGDVIALRPDMTPAIARMAVRHNLIVKGHPLRLCYIEKTFRDHERLQGRENEITQAGAELMGHSSAEADAEMIALAVQAFISAGLRNFRLDIGQVDFLPGILAEMEEALRSDEKQEFMDHMINRDYVAAEQLIAKSNTPAAALLSDLTCLTGSINVLKHAQAIVSKPQAKAALRHLEEVYAILQDQGIGEHILLDLSMTGQLDYYTGIIFKGYAKGSGATVVDGGRYDRMLAEFDSGGHSGRSIPAVGFGIKIDGLLEALNAQKVDFGGKSAHMLLSYSKNARASALSIADKMRKKGMRIENCLQSGDIQAQKAYAIQKKLDCIFYFAEENTVLLIDLKTGTEQKMTAEELMLKC